MTEKLMHLVQLDNGDIVLRDADANAKNQPLMTLSFSKEVDDILKEAKLEIAKVMLQAGIQRHQEILFAQHQHLGEQSPSGRLH